LLAPADAIIYNVIFRMQCRRAMNLFIARLCTAR